MIAVCREDLSSYIQKLHYGRFLASTFGNFLRWSLANTACGCTSCGYGPAGNWSRQLANLWGTHRTCPGNTRTKVAAAAKRVFPLSVVRDDSKSPTTAPSFKYFSVSKHTASMGPLTGIIVWAKKHPGTIRGSKTHLLTLIDINIGKWFVSVSTLLLTIC